MKTDPKDIASALVEAAQNVPRGKLAAECDEALRILHGSHSGSGRSMRLLPSLVRKILRRKGLVVHATLITPDGNAGKTADAVVAILSDALHKEISLEQAADPSMLGGAVLIVGDERFDVSVPGALDELRSFLSRSPSDSPIP